LNNFFTRNIQTKIRNVHTYANNEQSNETIESYFFLMLRLTSHGCDSFRALSP